MQSRNLSVSALAAQMKLSGNTSVLRILNNKSTLKGIEIFCQKLKNAFELTREEAKNLERALSHEQLPANVTRSRKLLSTLFLENVPLFEKKIKCTLKNANECKSTQYLGDEVYRILNSDPGDEIVLYIETIDNENFVHALHDVIAEHPGRKIDIHHFFDDTDDSEAGARGLYAMIKLSCFEGYNPYIINEGVYPSRRFYAKNITKDIATLVYIYDEEHYTCVEMKLSQNEYCRHTEEEFRILSEVSVSAKEKFNVPIEDLASYLEKCRRLDTCISYELKNTPCFMMIPMEIQESLYADCNYLGFGAEHPIVKKMYSIISAREKFIDEGNVEKYFVFTRKGLESFMETGKTSDYLPQMRPLTPEECRRTVMRNIDLPNTQVFILKEGYCMNTTECALFEGNIMSVFDPSYGYWDNFSEIGIRNKKMLRIMRDFIIEELMAHCCYSTEESREIILDIIK